MGFVYVYFTKEKECKYIGQSVDWKRRFYQHSKTDMKDKIQMIDSIVVFRCGNDKMNLIESYLINKYLPDWNKAIPKYIGNIDLSRYKRFWVPTSTLRG